MKWRENNEKFTISGLCRKSCEYKTKLEINNHNETHRGKEKSTAMQVSTKNLFALKNWSCVTITKMFIFIVPKLFRLDFHPHNDNDSNKSFLGFSFFCHFLFFSSTFSKWKEFIVIISWPLCNLWARNNNHHYLFLSLFHTFTCLNCLHISFASSFVRSAASSNYIPTFLLPFLCYFCCCCFCCCCCLLCATEIIMRDFQQKKIYLK